jgi:hypothetical protein
LASGVPLKHIQEWLGHSDFAITANLYAHLEFKSKVESANAMTWIGRTALGGNQACQTKSHVLLRGNGYTNDVPNFAFQP